MIERFRKSAFAAGMLVPVLAIAMHVVLDRQSHQAVPSTLLVSATTCLWGTAGLLSYLIARLRGHYESGLVRLGVALSLAAVLEAMLFWFPSVWPSVRLLTISLLLASWRPKLGLVVGLLSSVVVFAITTLNLSNLFAVTGSTVLVTAALVGWFLRRHCAPQVLIPYLVAAMSLALFGQLFFMFGRGIWEQVLVLAALLLFVFGLAIWLDQLHRGLQARLEIQQDKALELTGANESLEAFVRSASHDLKAPLRHTASFVGFVLKSAEDRLTDSEKSDLERVLQSSDHMTDMLNSLLIFARLGSSSLSYETFHLKEMVDLIVARLPAAQQSRVTVTGMSEVTADRNLLVLVLQNLIENGLKYVKGHEASVLIRSTTSSDGTHVQVIDNGIGMERSQVLRIFQPGVRGVSDSKFKGTGFGLASCHRIIEAHGGKIWVETKVGKGSTFHFTIPAVVDDAITNGLD